MSVKTSIANFDLTPFNIDTKEQRVDSVPCSKLHNLARRVQLIQERLGLFYVAFWKVKLHSAVIAVKYLCCDRFGWPVSEAGFEVIQPLESRHAGVLLKK